MSHPLYGALKHFGGNIMGAVGLWHHDPSLKPDSISFEQEQKEFVDSLEKVLAQNPTAYRGITPADVRAFVEQAPKTDWSKPKAFRQLQKSYQVLMDKEYLQ